MKALLEQTVRAVRAQFPGPEPGLGIVLGSGLGDWVQNLQDARSMPYGELPHFPQATVAGHPGRLWQGRIGNVSVAVLQGRVHGYEGHSAAMVAYPARVLCALGVKTL